MALAKSSGLWSHEKNVARYALPRMSARRNQHGERVRTSWLCDRHHAHQDSGSVTSTATASFAFATLSCGGEGQ